MEFSRLEYWSGQPFPSTTDLPDPGIRLGSSALQANSLLTELSGKPGGAIGISDTTKGIRAGWTIGFSVHEH